MISPSGLHLALLAQTVRYAVRNRNHGLRIEFRVAQNR